MLPTPHFKLLHQPRSAEHAQCTNGLRWMLSCIRMAAGDISRVQSNGRTAFCPVYPLKTLNKICKCPSAEEISVNHILKSCSSLKHKRASQYNITVLKRELIMNYGFIIPVCELSGVPTLVREQKLDFIHGKKSLCFSNT